MNTSAKIKWVVFDIGGVLINITPERTAKRYVELSGLPQEKVAELFKIAALTTATVTTFAEKFTIGKVSIDEYVQNIQERFPQKVSKDDIVAAEMLVLGEDIADTVQLLEDLKPKVGVACFSNTHKLHWDNLLAERAWYKHFGHIFASHTEGLTKPDPEVFRFMEKRLDAKPEECVFIDDNLNNARSAEACGWHSILFKDAAATRTTLVGLGVLSA